MKNLFNRLGIDRAIIYTVFFRMIQALGGVGTVIFIARFLSKNQQGYYYTFGSLIAIQVFFELGLCSIITQYVAHEMAHLTWRNEQHTQGDAVNQSRISSLLHFCVKWFAIIGSLFFLSLIVVGFCFFSKYGGDHTIEWRGPWIILAFATSGFLFVDPLLAFLEGLGKVPEIARMRLIQQTTYIICVITFLISGFKLYASAIATLMSFLCIVCLLLPSNNFKILKNLWQLKGEWLINYRTEIFPYQWKIALSWISGYFIFQMFNPVLFATEGAVVAGQMGITLAALNGLMGLSMSWINTKVPLFSGLIAKKAYQELDSRFFLSFGQSLFVTTSGLCVLFIGVNLLQSHGFPIGSRFLAAAPLAFMCLSYLLNNVVFGLATYLRCHKQEPLLIQSVVFAICTSSSTILLGNRYGVFGITLGYLILIVAIGLPWVTAIFITKRKQWHYADNLPS